MPFDGGLPQRETWHGRSALVVGWTPAGEVLYATRKYSTLPNAQLVATLPGSGVQRRIPLAQAAEGSYDATGSTLYFARFSKQGSHTKRYRGGTAQDIWSFTEGEPTRPVALTPDYTGKSRHPPDGLKRPRLLRHRPRRDDESSGPCEPDGGRRAASTPGTTGGMCSCAGTSRMGASSTRMARIIWLLGARERQDEARLDIRARVGLRPDARTLDRRIRWAT